MASLFLLFLQLLCRGGCSHLPVGRCKHRPRQKYNHCFCIRIRLYAINGVVDNITLADLVDWQMQKANEYVI